MKYKVTKFKSLHTCIKELEPFIRNGQHLQTGKPFKCFEGLRSRELLANWLLCVAVNSFTQPDRLTFSSDPTGGDGVIIDSATGETWPTEHVIVPTARPDEKKDIETLILEKINLKQKKGGAEYASGKTLVVFLNADLGEWYPNKIAKRLPETLDFEAVWVVALQGVEESHYVYNATRLDLSRGNAPIWRIRIWPAFDGWDVTPIQ